jgi:cholesterol oxidase
MMLDDHEIDDNWEPLPHGADPARALQVDRLMQAGSQAYQRYQRDLFQSELLPFLWHTHVHRGIRFFLADTRTERHPRDARHDPLHPSIMNGTQTAELHDWIRAEAHQPAFVSSPSMLLPRRRRSAASRRAALHSDAWDGYPGSLYRLLVHIWKTGRSNLVFLSGDEHLSSVIRATVTRRGHADRAVVLHSVHSSGLYAPYPFANAVPALFALPDDWTFEDPDQPDDCYRCVVENCTRWVPGDGFALLRLTPPVCGAGSGDWQLDVEFDRANGTVTVPSLRLARGPGPLQRPPV